MAALPLLAELSLPLVKVGGYFLPMKSVESDEEIASAAPAIEILGGRLADVKDYVVPGTNVKHRLVIIEKVKTSPAEYPRAFAKIKKAPL